MRAMIMVACALVACGKGDGGIDKGASESKGAVKKISEAELQLNAIAKKAKLVFAESSKFPVGTSKVMPARDGEVAGAGGCCGGKSSGGSVDNKCAVAKDWGADPVWKAMGFSIDEPSNYRYKYESSDGASFVVTAAGDLDCDGQEAVFTLKGTSTGGNAAVELVKPASGVY